MATNKQADAAKRNVKKAQQAAKDKRTIANLPKSTRRELGKQRIFVLGHSFGSFLGLQLVELHPEWLYAYIGACQLIDDVVTA